MAGLRRACRFAARHGTAAASVAAVVFVAVLIAIPRPGPAGGRDPRTLLWECHASGGDSGHLAATLLGGSGRTIVPAPAARPGSDSATARRLAFGSFSRE